MTLNERMINAFYGLAVADSCGNIFEFKTNVNPDDVISHANDSKVLTITDDSQLNFFSQEAINNLDLYEGDIFQKVRKSFTDSYIDWFTTQSEEYDNSDEFEFGLLQFKSMFSVQAPGLTCLNSLRKIKNYEEVINDSMGNSSVVRVLPLLCLLQDKYELTFTEVLKCAKITGNITHKHRANDTAIETFMYAAKDILNDIRPFSLEADHIEELGDGWIAQECINMALWAYNKAQTFDELLTLSICHSGDSDSVSALSGALWGLSGREIPQKYIKKLDCLDVIDYIVERLNIDEFKLYD